MIMDSIPGIGEKYYAYSRWNCIAIQKGSNYYGRFNNRWRLIARAWNDDTWGEITEDEMKQRLEALEEGQQ